MSSYTVDSLLAGTKAPAFLGPFAEAKFGMSKEELKSASPAYAKHGDYLMTDELGLDFGVYFDGEPEGLSSMNVDIPAAEVPKLEAVWGAPIEYTDRKQPVVAWHNAENHTRALLKDGSGGEGKTLWISEYLSADEILGKPGGPLGIKKDKPLLGSSPADLEAAYPKAFDRTLDTLMFMKWPADELGDKFGMELSIEDGVTTQLQFWLHHGGNETVKTELFAKLEAKFGKAKEVKTYSGKELFLGDGPKVRVKALESTWVIEISPKEG